LEAGKLKLTCDIPAELAGHLGMTMGLKLMMPQDLHENALHLLQTWGFTASQNGIGLRVLVSPSAKLAPVQRLLAENIEVSNFEIENGL
jgi:hypothetical protein